ncbi:hypothetical protein [Chamaesiphon sp. VAR_48_metabat_135_sub]|uniref:hypothetical protein n=1 Tax=Chamaesiphon sp. VAR_48_metabat_135_sub TaxID=2964699 RepID=UPI00286D3E01|nr:hypothetical protein [Chamaesiphon sp. VAR_48_metabat_135_sub]
MLLTLNIFPLLQAQSAKLKAQIAEWDRNLALRYGNRYHQIKQQLEGAKTWYTQTKSAAQNSGTIPLEQKQTEAHDRFAEAGAVAARKEAVIKQQLKDLWHSIRNR